MIDKKRERLALGIRGSPCIPRSWIARAVIEKFAAPDRSQTGRQA